MAPRPHAAPSRTPAMYVALLRGINVGGKNRLSMALLAELLEQFGCGQVRTYIQSGNAVFTASSDLAERLGRDLPARVHKRLGFAPSVVVRSALEMTRIIASNPFLTPDQDQDRLHVAFLADRPTADRVARLDPRRSPGDRFVVRGREIYLHLPGGAGKSKLTNAYFDAGLGTVSMIRNWRTVLTLHQMASQPDSAR